MSETPTPQHRAELRRLAGRLAIEAGRLALTGRRSIDGDGVDGLATSDTKSSVTDVVTEFDRAAERHIVTTLRDLRPDDAIIGEEGTADSGTSGFAWFIDPIDGTTNFVYDIPAWTCSIGVAYLDEMIAGAVFNPSLDELFEASRGDGAALNGVEIRASTATQLPLALIGTGFGYDPDRRRQQAARVLDLIADVRDIRRFGSAAMDLCMVACGRLDAYYERDLNSWDAAAGELIAREAGAVTSDFDGQSARPSELVAAAPGIHRALLQALSRPIATD